MCVCVCRRETAGEDRGTALIHVISDMLLSIQVVSQDTHTLTHSHSRTHIQKRRRRAPEPAVPLQLSEAIPCLRDRHRPQLLLILCKHVTGMAWGETNEGAFERRECMDGEGMASWMDGWMGWRESGANDIEREQLRSVIVFRFFNPNTSPCSSSSLLEAVVESLRKARQIIYCHVWKRKEDTRGDRYQQTRGFCERVCL